MKCSILKRVIKFSSLYGEHLAQFFVADNAFKCCTQGLAISGADQECRFAVFQIFRNGADIGAKNGHAKTERFEDNKRQSFVVGGENQKVGSA